MKNWHDRTIQKFKKLSNEELIFIQNDAREAYLIGEKLGNPKTGRYKDEANYAYQEIARRKLKYGAIQ